MQTYENHEAFFSLAEQDTEVIERLETEIKVLTKEVQSLTTQVTTLQKENNTLLTKYKVLVDKHLKLSYDRSKELAELEELRAFRNSLNPISVC